MATSARGWGTEAADQPLGPMTFERRALRANDVAIDISYAGICHSDVHTCRNDWHNSCYPGTRSSAPSPPSDPTSASTRSATRSRSAAWSTAA